MSLVGQLKIPPLLGWFPIDIRCFGIYWWWQLNVSRPCFGSGFVVMYWLHELSLSHFLTQIAIASAIWLHFNTFPPHIWAHFRGHIWAHFQAYFWTNVQVQCRVEIFWLWDLGRTLYCDLLAFFWALQKMFFSATRSSCHMLLHPVVQGTPATLKIKKSE